MPDKKRLAQMDKGLAAAVRVAGNVNRLARLVGVPHQSIYKWRRIPAERVQIIAKMTGLSRHQLRPDLYEKG